MGSFSELVLSFSLRTDVGAEVLAAFASLAVPDTLAPPLPPASPADEDWELDYPDCDMTDPWSHDWGVWLGASYTTSYIGSDQRASMIWRKRQWVVTARATWKSIPEVFVDNLAVLGSVIDASNGPLYESHEAADHLNRGILVGYAKHEAEPRPWLLWANGQTLEGENLNPPGFSL